MSELLATMPQYFADIRDKKIHPSNFVKKWDTAGPEFQGAVIKHLADGNERTYNAIVKTVGDIAGYRGPTAAKAFLLSLGMHDIRGENYDLAVTRMCEDKFQLIGVMLAQLNTGAMKRDDLQVTLESLKTPPNRPQEAAAGDKAEPPPRPRG